MTCVIWSVVTFAAGVALTWWFGRDFARGTSRETRLIMDALEADRRDERVRWEFERDRSGRPVRVRLFYHGEAHLTVPPPQVRGTATVTPPKDP